MCGDASWLETIDNYAMLLIDTVWAAWKLGDISRLAVSAQRLARARASLEKAHGRNLERLAATGLNRAAASALYVRLETLEAVAAYYGADVAAAEAKLRSARAKWQSLQVHRPRKWFPAFAAIVGFESLCFIPSAAWFSCCHDMNDIASYLDMYDVFCDFNNARPSIAKARTKRSFFAVRLRCQTAPWRSSHPWGMARGRRRAPCAWPAVTSTQLWE